MGKPSPPDPVATAAAQGAMNRETAITEYGLNATDQINPYGQVRYSQVGEWEDGTPRFQQETSFSPEQQAIFDQTQQAQRSLAGIANQQSSFLADYLGGGIDLSGLPELQGDFNGDLGLQTTYAGADDFSADRQRVEDALWERTAGDRQSQEAALRTRLLNSGIREGSAAWNAEMERMARQDSDARLGTILAGGAEQQRMVDMARQAAEFGNTSALAQGQFGMAAQQAGNQARQQGFAEQMALRNQPINEISALMSGSQVSNPAAQSGPTPGVGVAGVDYAGLVNQNYQQRLAASQGLWGGIGGLFGTLGGMFSDARLKENMRRVGQTDGGVPIYSYNYIWGGPTQIGVMAQDVPHAAYEHESGFLVVDYGKVV